MRLSAPFLSVALLVLESKQPELGKTNGKTMKMIAPEKVMEDLPLQVECGQR
jgi:hypothetical protein